jgi:hypothetical protein
VLKEIFSAAGAAVAFGAAGLAEAAVCAGSFLSEELATAVSVAFLQDANERGKAQHRIQNMVLFIEMLSMLIRWQNDEINGRVNLMRNTSRVRRAMGRWEFSELLSLAFY